MKNVTAWTAALEEAVRDLDREKLFECERVALEGARTAAEADDLWEALDEAREAIAEAEYEARWDVRWARAEAAERADAQATADAYARGFARLNGKEVPLDKCTDWMVEVIRNAVTGGRGLERIAP